MKNLIYHFPTCYAYSVKKPIGELNLKRALDEDTGVFSFFFSLLYSSSPLGRFFFIFILIFCESLALYVLFDLSNEANCILMAEGKVTLPCREVLLLMAIFELICSNLQFTINGTFRSVDHQLK